MRERPPPRAGQDRALDDAVVGQRVVEDQVAGPEQWPIIVSFVAWPPTKTMAVFGAEELGDRPFQLPCIGFSPDTSRLAETLVP